MTWFGRIDYTVDMDTNTNPTTRTWAVDGFGGSRTTVGGTRRDARREAVARAAADLLPGRRVATLVSESR